MVVHLGGLQVEHEVVWYVLGLPPRGQDKDSK
jgi:hypothetical protein